MIKGVIFDMDGLMFDTERIWATLWKPALATLGLPYKEGLDAAAGVPGLSVKVNCVPLKGTEDEEYIRLVLLAKEGKADVRFIEMMPIGMGKDFAGRGREEICAVLEKIYGKAAAYTG